MDSFGKEKEFFRRLNGRHPKIKPLEMIALECFYPDLAPCELDRETVIKNTASKILARVKTVKHFDQAMLLARRSVPVAIKKFKKLMAEAETDTANLPEPWWARY
jgi:hypothetical protein